MTAVQSAERNWAVLDCGALPQLSGSAGVFVSRVTPCRCQSFVTPGSGIMLRH